ncbi:MAG TPA: hypothetical protein VIK11_02810 [Tepidiformaceae bacterium]
MATNGRLNLTLMTTDLRVGDAPGFHRIVFRIESDRRPIGQVTVQISQDAFRKLRSQILRLTNARPDDASLLRGWAKWALAARLESGQPPQPLITVTASDIDDFGTCASEVRRTLRAS